MKKIISITLAIIFVLGALAGCSCSNSKKAPATKSSQKTSSKVETNQSLDSDESETINTENTTVPSITPNGEVASGDEEEGTTVPVAKEEETTKPVVKEETTTKKPNNQTTSKKENQTTSKKEQTTTKPTVNANQFTYEIWDEPVIYKFSDDINEQINVYELPSKDSELNGWYSKGGMTVEITGICKENGWYRIKRYGGVGYVSNEYKVIKKADRDVSFEEYESIEDYIEGLYIDNPYLGYLYLRYPGESTVSGEEVKIYSNRTIEDLLYIYSYIMPRYKVHYYCPEEGLYGTETVEELINHTFGENGYWNLQHYKNGEALAKYYGLDFHSEVEVLKSWGLVDFDELTYKETYQKVYCSEDITFNSYLKEKPHESARFFLANELEEYGGFSTIGEHFYITKNYIDWPWYEILYIESETDYVGDRVIVAYIRKEDFERYYQEGVFSYNSPVE